MQPSDPTRQRLSDDAFRRRPARRADPLGSLDAQPEPGDGPRSRVCRGAARPDSSIAGPPDPRRSRRPVGRRPGSRLSSCSRPCGPIPTRRLADELEQLDPAPDGRGRARRPVAGGPADDRRPDRVPCGATSAGVAAARSPTVRCDRAAEACPRLRVSDGTSMSTEPALRPVHDASRDASHGARVPGGVSCPRMPVGPRVAQSPNRRTTLAQPHRRPCRRAARDSHRPSRELAPPPGPPAPGPAGDPARRRLGPAGHRQPATGHILDGHARVEEALARHEPTVPVTYVELDPDEERSVLATFDVIGCLATPDPARSRRCSRGSARWTPSCGPCSMGLAGVATRVEPSPGIDPDASRTCPTRGDLRPPGQLVAASASIASCAATRSTRPRSSASWPASAPRCS